MELDYISSSYDARRPFIRQIDGKLFVNGTATYLERYVEAKSADHPNPWNAVFLMSYDTDSKRWVRNGVDNSGSRNAASSSGWIGDAWVWENDGVNIVINRSGASAFSFAVDVKQSGEVNRVVEASCKRV